MAVVAVAVGQAEVGKGAVEREVAVREAVAQVEVGWVGVMEGVVRAAVKEAVGLAVGTVAVG